MGILSALNVTISYYLYFIYRPSGVKVPATTLFHLYLHLKRISKFSDNFRYFLLFCASINIEVIKQKVIRRFRYVRFFLRRQSHEKVFATGKNS